MPMDARKFRILQAIIDDYIMTAIPVGSRTISKKYEMGLSSATIRNEMSDLEELGYLEQPHVSAGRVPNTKAYRLYVDRLLQSGMIGEKDVSDVRSFFDRRAVQMEDVINQAAQAISGLTHYTSLVLSPQGSELHIRNLQLVPVSSQSALLVVVTDGGIIRDTVIPTGTDLDSDALYAVSRMLTERLSGHTIAQAQEILGLAEQQHEEARTVLSGVGSFMESVESDNSRTRLALGGTGNIFNFPEYNDVEKARGFLQVLETKDKLLQLMQEHGEMAFSVRIGPETGIPELSDCSLVTATYQLSDHTRGTIGVIGPTRMQYGRVLSILNAMGRELSEMLDQSKE